MVIDDDDAVPESVECRSRARTLHFERGQAMLKLNRAPDIRNERGEQIDFVLVEVADAPRTIQAQHSGDAIVRQRVRRDGRLDVLGHHPLAEEVRPRVFVPWNELFGREHAQRRIGLPHLAERIPACPVLLVAPLVIRVLARRDIGQGVRPDVIAPERADVCPRRVGEFVQRLRPDRWVERASKIRPMSSRSCRDRSVPAPGCVAA
jgi:hypothetical protein